MKKDKYEYLKIIDNHLIKDKLGIRDQTGHKGTFGTLFCLCGSLGMSGAAVMSAMVALRCGVGMVRIGTIKAIYDIVAQAVPEATFVILPENFGGTLSFDSLETILKTADKCSALLIGCGLGRDNDLFRLVNKVIEKTDIPLVIDADGINAVAQNINILNRAKSRAVITPHIGEMARLLNTSINDVLSNRSACAKEISKKYGIVTVLKSSETIVSNEEGDLFINRIQNSGMAKGGSGDVLAGIISSFLAQGFSPLDASLCGVYVHSMVGLKCKEKYSEISMLPTDLIKELPSAFLEINV